MKNVLLIISLIVFAAMVGYGAWHLERWVNWSLGYSNDVEEQIKPLEKRIDALEEKILKKNKGGWFILVPDSLVDTTFQKVYPSFSDSLVWLLLGDE